MRVRITRTLAGSIDGITLDRLKIGRIYDVGTSLASYLLCLQLAEPVADERPVMVIPLEDDIASLLHLEPHDEAG